MCRLMHIFIVSYMVSGRLTWGIKHANTVRPLKQIQAWDPPTDCIILPQTNIRFCNELTIWKLICHLRINSTTVGLRSPMKTAYASVFAWCKNARHPPSGLLQLLLVPGQSWSHISSALLPDSLLLKVIPLTKAVHFVPLPKLPLVLEAATLFIQHVLCLHDIPPDIISDQGLQFSSHAWQAFCRGCICQPVLWLPHSI